MSEDVFRSLMNDYNFILSIDAWSTKDLVALSNAIDAELQKRHDEGTLEDDDDVAPWEDKQ